MTQEEINFRHHLDCLRVPPRYHRIPHDLKLPKKVFDWTEDRDAWSLTILGPAGTGKTWLAVSVLELCFFHMIFVHRPRDSWQLPRFMDAGEAVEQIKREFNTPNDGATQQILQSARGLLLDDLGASKATDFYTEQINLALRHRYNAQLPTIITSNATSLKAFEERIASRLSEGYVVELAGKDRRARTKGVG